MTRTVQAMRVQLLIWRRTVLLPWATLALVFAVNVGIFAFVSTPSNGRHTTGGVVAIYFYPVAFTLQAVTQTFPFAAGLGLTRRAFAQATALTVTGQAVLTGVVLFALSRLEQATGGWGESLYFFRVPDLLTANRPTQLFMFIAPMLFTGFLGFLLGTLNKRFGLTGVLIGIAGLIAVGGAAAIVVSWQRDWTALYERVAALSAFTLVVATPVVLAALCGAGAWGVLRRAVA